MKLFFSQLFIESNGAKNVKKMVFLIFFCIPTLINNKQWNMFSSKYLRNKIIKKHTDSLEK
jgi:hypothetical protein